MGDDPCNIKCIGMIRVERIGEGLRAMGQFKHVNR